MAFCKCCGYQMADDAKFCLRCGTKKVTQQPPQNEERKTVYDGEIHKCPNCGDILDAYEAVCSACGYEQRGTQATGAVQELAFKLQQIESERTNRRNNNGFGFAQNAEIDLQKINLIRSFVIPNTKEDILEFAVLAASNVDTGAYDLYSSVFSAANARRRETSEAWLAKLKQAHQKAKLVFGNDPRITEIQSLYDTTHKAIRRAKGRVWKILGNILGAFIALFILIGIIVISSVENDQKEENARLEAIEVQVQEALQTEDYTLALMHAGRLYYGENDEKYIRDWQIKREFWIGRVIEEAAEDGIILEPPTEPVTEIPEENTSKSEPKKETTEKNDSKNEGTAKSSKDDMNAQTASVSVGNASVQIAVREYCEKQYWGYKSVFVIENLSDFNFDLSANVKFYDKSGKLVGAKSDSVYYFEHGTKTVMQFSVDEAYEWIEYEFSAKEQASYDCIVSSLTYESVPAKNKEILSVTNTGSVPAQSVWGYALFFKDGELVGTDMAYFADDDWELKPGKTITEELTIYDKKYDSVEFYFTGHAA